MTKAEKQAIERMNKALQGLKKVGIQICGMDLDLLYATKKGLKNARQHRGGHSGDYCEVARACQSDTTGETGKFETSGIYQDSGGW